jgi:ankyrin repeat protein
MKIRTLLVAAVLLLVLGAGAFADGMVTRLELFFQAVRRGDVAYVKSELDAGEENINVTNSDGQTAIMVAVDAEKVAMVTALLTYKPDLNIEDPNHKTVFDIAEQKGNVVISQALEKARNE